MIHSCSYSNASVVPLSDETDMLRTYVAGILTGKSLGRNIGMVGAAKPIAGRIKKMKTAPECILMMLMIVDHCRLLN